MRGRVERNKTIDELLVELSNSQDKMSWIESQNLDRRKLNKLFVEAAEKGHLDEVQFLVSLPGVNPTAQDNDAIRSAARNGYLNVVRFLAFLPGVNPAAQDDYALRWAVINGHEDVVRFLVSLPGVNPAPLNNDALFLAAVNGHLSIVQFLVSFPVVNPAAEDNEALREAVENGNLDIVLALAAHPSVTATEDMPKHLQQIIRAVKLSQSALQNHFTFFKAPGILKDAKQEILGKGLAELKQTLPDGVDLDQVIHCLKF